MNAKENIINFLRETKFLIVSTGVSIGVIVAGAMSTINSECKLPGAIVAGVGLIGFWATMGAGLRKSN